MGKELPQVHRGLEAALGGVQGDREDTHANVGDDDELGLAQGVSPVLHLADRAHHADILCALGGTAEALDPVGGGGNLLQELAERLGRDSLLGGGG